MQNCRYIKLVNGEDILADQIAVSKSSIVLQNVVRVFASPTIRGSISIALVPWDLFTTGEYTISKKNVLINSEANDDFNERFVSFIKKKEMEEKYHAQTPREKAMAQDLMNFMNDYEGEIKYN